MKKKMQMRNIVWYIAFKSPTAIQTMKFKKKILLTQTINNKNYITME